MRKTKKSAAKQIISKLEDGFAKVGLSINVLPGATTTNNTFTSEIVHKFIIVPVTKTQYEVRHEQTGGRTPVWRTMGGHKICSCDSREDAEAVAKAMMESK